MNLPQEFEKRMRALLGGEYPTFAHALQKERPVRALYRTHKISAAALRDALPFPLTPLSCSPDGFLCEQERLGAHPLHHAGAFYIQDPSAQATLCALPDDLHGLRVLDACAAPGGKSVRIGGTLAAGGFLIANEADPARARILAQNIERAGLYNTAVTALPAEELAELYDGCFDLVLADVPCSGEGMFRKYPAALADWNPGGVRKCAGMQKRILDGVCGTVAPGGYLLYSTCTFSLEENERQIAAFLSRHPDFCLVPVNEKLLPVTVPAQEEAPLARRFYPHLAPGEGQFIALLRRAEDVCCRGVRFRAAERRLSAQEQTVLADFLHTYTDLSPDRLHLCAADGMVWGASASIPLPERGVVGYGAALGKIQKGVFRPHHHLFSAFGGRFLQQIDLPSDSAGISDYLCGRTLSADPPDGWRAVLTDGVPLGGAKAVGGILKNHYPKGLRAAPGRPLSPERTLSC